MAAAREIKTYPGKPIRPVADPDRPDPSFLGGTVRGSRLGNLTPAQERKAHRLAFQLRHKGDVGLAAIVITLHFEQEWADEWAKWKRGRDRFDRIQKSGALANKKTAAERRIQWEHMARELATTCTPGSMGALEMCRIIKARSDGKGRIEDDLLPIVRRERKAAGWKS